LVSMGNFALNFRNLRRIAALLAVMASGLLLAPQTAFPQKAHGKRAATRKPVHKTLRKAPVKHHAARLKARPTRRSTTRAGVIHTGSAASVRTRRSHRRKARRALYNPWTEPTYADSTVGDSIGGDDPVARKAAVDALGPFNGTVVVADPHTGRILTIVNQKLGLKGAFQPCSTVKVVVSFASLSEGVVEASTKVPLTRRTSIDMTKALAISSNQYFAKLGQKLGFERVEKYAKLFGLGEKAGLDIAGEEAGYLAEAAPVTGVGMMTSFGDGIRLTPLELTSIVSAVSNGGTMYYLQYPKSQEEAENFVPRIKRELDIAKFVPMVRPGMMGAVEFGTARRAIYDENDPVFGKTGTCTDTAQPGVHLGWFGSFNDVEKNKVAVVVLLTGGRGVAGPIAAGVAGNVYRNLSAQGYFGDPGTTVATKLVSMQNCCRR
jgi:penicillin-binding protein 2